MPRSKPWTDDGGSAALEFVTAALVLLVPLVYLVLTMSAIQSAALAVDGASRQAARVYVQAATVAQARERATRAVEFALADHGVDAEYVQIAVSCLPEAGDCLTRRGFVTVTVEVSVPLPFVPEVIPGDFPLAVPIRSEATQQVSRFWSDQ